jgi:hypothetical protein
MLLGLGRGSTPDSTLSESVQAQAAPAEPDEADEADEAAPAEPPSTSVEDAAAALMRYQGDAPNACTQPYPPSAPLAGAGAAVMALSEPASQLAAFELAESVAESVALAHGADRAQHEASEASERESEVIAAAREAVAAEAAQLAGLEEGQKGPSLYPSWPPSHRPSQQLKTSQQPPTSEQPGMSPSLSLSHQVASGMGAGMGAIAEDEEAEAEAEAKDVEAEKAGAEEAAEGGAASAQHGVLWVEAQTGCFGGSELSAPYDIAVGCPSPAEATPAAERLAAGRLGAEGDEAVETPAHAPRAEAAAASGIVGGIAGGLPTAVQSSAVVINLDSDEENGGATSTWQQGEAAAFDINQERMHCELLGERIFYAVD